jgi:hypothetical protein
VDLDLILFVSTPTSASFKEACDVYLHKFKISQSDWQIKVIQSIGSERQEDFYQLQIMDSTGKSIADINLYPLKPEESLKTRLEIYSQRGVIDKIFFYDLTTSEPYQLGTPDRAFHVRRNPFRESPTGPIDFKALALIMKELALRNPEKPESQATKEFIKQLNGIAKKLRTNPYADRETQALDQACGYLIGVYYSGQTQKSQGKITAYLEPLIAPEGIKRHLDEAARRETKRQEQRKTEARVDEAKTKKAPAKPAASAYPAMATAIYTAPPPPPAGGAGVPSRGYAHHLAMVVTATAFYPTRLSEFPPPPPAGAGGPSRPRAPK